MYILSIFNKNQQITEFYFDGMDKAVNALAEFDDLEKPSLLAEISDDYGHMAVIRIDDISSAIISDLERKFTAKADCEMIRTAADRRLQAQMAAAAQPAIVVPHRA